MAIFRIIATELATYEFEVAANDAAQAKQIASRVDLDKARVVRIGQPFIQSIHEVTQ